MAKNNWLGGSLQERKKRLDQIAEVIKECNIAVLQEADFRAPWTYFIQNQYQYLKRKADFPHSMAFTTHRFWPSAGIAVLSRFPLEEREVVKLPQYLKLETLLGYQKHGLACTVRAKPPFRLIAVHFDYRGRAVTVPAAERLVQYAQQQNLPVVIAGDFNATPLSFPNPRDSKPTALDLLRNCGLFRSLPASDPQSEDMTHPTDDPRCILDWILIPKDWTFRSYGACDVTLSDHRPVKARVNKAIKAGQPAAVAIKAAEVK